jgi:hypothetical protein
VKRILFSLFWLLSYFLTYAQNSRIEKVILDKVAALPEVRSFFKTAKKTQPALMIAGTPDKNRKYYWVKVGLSNLGIFRTSFDLYVDPKTYEVFYADYMTERGEQLLTLEQWRKWRKLPVWQSGIVINIKTRI